MRVLLDTHILLWSAFDSPKLPDDVKIMIQDETNEIICSTASIWEVAIKHSADPERLKFWDWSLHVIAELQDMKSCR